MAVNSNNLTRFDKSTNAAMTDVFGKETSAPCATKPLIDSFGRRINYLRLSITDRCNLRCLYCMPQEGVSWISHDEVLRFEEILAICRVLAALGINAVKVTGGEPLARRGAVDLIRELRSINGISSVTLTSNGVLLGEHLDALATAGLEAVNISLDTLDKEKFRYLTRSEGFEKILPAIDKALALGLKLKINCVPMRGFNEDDIVKLAAMAKDKSIAVRFIELMPVGVAAFGSGTSVFRPLAFDEVFSMIEKAYGSLSPSEAKPGNGPASYYTLPGFAGHIGFISAISRCFCDRCNRLRLTSSGLLKPCLSGNTGLDLRSLLRNGAANGTASGSGDAEIAEAIRKLVLQKPSGHSFGRIENQEHVKNEMFRIGG